MRTCLTNKSFFFFYSKLFHYSNQSVCFPFPPDITSICAGTHRHYDSARGGAFSNLLNHTALVNKHISLISSLARRSHLNPAFLDLWQMSAPYIEACTGSTRLFFFFVFLLLWGVGLSLRRPGQMRQYSNARPSARDSRWMGRPTVAMERLHWAAWPGGAHQSGARAVAA